MDAQSLVRSFVGVALILFVAGCGATPVPTAPPVTVIAPTTEPTPAPIPPSPAPTATRVPPTFTPTLTATPTRPVPTSTPTIAGATSRVKIFLIALEDNGKSGKKIGCNDSVIAIERIIPQTAAPLRAALEELLNLRERFYGQSGLYNVLYQSNLKLDSASITNAKATIHLSGTLRLSGVCDNPRVEAQIEETALQFATVKQVEVFLNNIALEKALSLK